MGRGSSFRGGSGTLRREQPSNSGLTLLDPRAGRLGVDGDRAALHKW